MRQLLTSLFFLLALATPAAAQTTPAAYQGPTFPGGPDSLRAYLGRQQLPKAGAGPVFVQFDVVPNSRPKNLQVLAAPGRQPLSPATTAAALAVAQAMPDWAPGRQDTDIPITTVTLALNLPRSATPALAYADEMPVFPGMKPGIIGLYYFLPTVQVVLPEIVRDKLKGDVYAYFEVAESGRIENQQIIGGDSPVLNKAAMLTIAKLPNATAPARLRGRPVRIYYVLSIGFAVE